MKVFLSDIEKVIKTIPIGYYALSRFEIVPDKEVEMSCFNPESLEIVVSLKQIQKGLEFADESFFETAVRSMVYHEISHALLTPSELEITEIVNIFEDERIETLSSGFYKNINFKENVLHINGYRTIDDVPEPKTALEAFYQAVRYRIGTEDDLSTIENIIFYFTDLNWDNIYEYVDYIDDLWKKIQARFKNPVFFPPPKKDFFSSIKISDEEKGKREDLYKFLLKKSVARADNFINNTFFSELNTLFENFSKKSAGRENFSAYSGFFNVKSVVREDFRYFDRIAKRKGPGDFGAIHVNLFQDVSGSYRANTTITNQFIATLILLEKQYSFFTFDVIACERGEKVLPKKNRFINCAGGNDLDHEILKIFPQVQKPLTYNYNLVLFDGYAYTDSIQKDTFRSFNTTNTTIISDPSNQKCIMRDAPNARKIFIKNNYPGKLWDELLKTFQIALQ